MVQRIDLCKGVCWESKQGCWEETRFDRVRNEGSREECKVKKIQRLN